MLEAWILVLTVVGVDCLPYQTGRILNQPSSEVLDLPFRQLLDVDRRNQVDGCQICPFIPGADVLCILNHNHECDVHEHRCFRGLGVETHFHGFSYTKIDYDGKEAWARTETAALSCPQGSHGDGSATYHPMVTYIPSVGTTTKPAAQISSHSIDSAHPLLFHLLSNMGVNTHEGVLMVTYNNNDYAVCADGWTDENTRVACNTIGSQQGYVASYQAIQDYGIPVFGGQVTCHGPELDLSMCPRHRETHCPNNSIIRVTCSISAPLHVNLVSSTVGRPHEGILIITTGGTDHVACADGWTDENSRVVCTTIGAPHGHVTSYNAVQDYGIPVLNEKIVCNGWELDLSTCPRHRDDRPTHCLNNDVVYVTCSAPAPTTTLPSQSTTQTSTITPTTTSTTPTTPTTPSTIPTTPSTTPTTPTTPSTTPTTTSTTPTTPTTPSTTPTTTVTTTTTPTTTTPTTTTPTTTGHWINFGKGNATSTSITLAPGWVHFG